MTQRSAFARRPLAAALFVALIAPGMAFAQTAKEKALEARVADLERQVQLLLSSQQQQQAVLTETQAQVTEVKTVQAAEAARVPAGKQRIQAVSITPGAVPGTTFKVGGFIKADFLATRTGDQAYVGCGEKVATTVRDADAQVREILDYGDENSPESEPVGAEGES